MAKDISVVSIEDWPKDDYVTAAVIDETADALAERLNIEFMVDYPDGLGESRIQLCQLEDGTPFILEQLLQAPAPANTQTQIKVLNDASVMISALPRIIEALGSSDEQITWQNPLTGTVQTGRPPAPKP